MNKDEVFTKLMATQREILSHVNYHWRTKVVLKSGAYLHELADRCTLGMLTAKVAAKLLLHHKAKEAYHG